MKPYDYVLYFSLYLSLATYVFVVVFYNGKLLVQVFWQIFHEVSDSKSFYNCHLQSFAVYSISYIQVVLFKVIVYKTGDASLCVQIYLYHLIHKNK